MKKDISIMTTSSRRTYVCPVITVVFLPRRPVLQGTSPTPEVLADPEQDAYETLSRKTGFDAWDGEE